MSDIDKYYIKICEKLKVILKYITCCPIVLFALGIYLPCLTLVPKPENEGFKKLRCSYF